MERTVDTTESISKLKDLLNDAAEQIAQLKTRERQLKQQLKDAIPDRTIQQSSSQQQTMLPYHSEIFEEEHTGNFVSGLGFVDRDEFASAFDIGVPLDETQTGNDRVLLLYSDPNAFPQNDGKGPISVEDATVNCHNLHLILSHPRNHQCIAIMGQYESFHVHKYMRINSETGKMDANVPLTYQSRGKQQNGRISAKVPTTESVKFHWESLVTYLSSLDAALADLKPILEQVAIHNDNNAVIVMVCNFGQSELLLNCKMVSFIVWK